MEAVGRLAGGVAHDFNNILNVISVDSDMLMDKLEDPDSRELLEEISKVIDRGASIVRELLTFSRPQEVEPVVVDLDAIVEDTRRMMQVLLGQAVALEIEKPDSTARVSIDRRQMEQVLMNLAANARDAMPDGGTLSFTIALEMVSREASHTLGIGPGKFVRMAVRDTGTGIDDVVRGRIFEPFFTTKEVGKGTGLGLSTTYGIITRAGGTIRCESKPDAGTTFYVYLPVAEGRGFTGGGTA
jgi:signal transduction histidine kinase